MSEFKINPFKSSKIAQNGATEALNFFKTETLTTSGSEEYQEKIKYIAMEYLPDDDAYFEDEDDEIMDFNPEEIPIESPSQQPSFGEMQPQQPSFGGMQPQQPTTGEMQPQQPSTGGMQPQQPSTGGMQPQQPSTGEMQPQQPSTGEMQPQQPSTGGMQPQQPSTGGMQPQQPSFGEMQPQQPPFGGMQPQQPTTGEMQPQQPSFGEMQPQQPPFDEMQPQQPSTGGMQPQQQALNTPQAKLQNINNIILELARTLGGEEYLADNTEYKELLDLKNLYKEQIKAQESSDSSNMEELKLENNNNISSTQNSQLSDYNTEFFDNNTDISKSADWTNETETNEIEINELTQNYYKKLNEGNLISYAKHILETEGTEAYSNLIQKNSYLEIGIFSENATVEELEEQEKNTVLEYRQMWQELQTKIESLSKLNVHN